MFFIDMDGVLAVYEPSDYMGDPMPFEAPGIHYFDNRPVDRDAGLFLALMMSRLRDGGVYVLSTLSANASADPDLAFEHRSDKMRWLERLCAGYGLDAPPLLFAVQGGCTKATVAEMALGRKLGPNDILVDDFNANLRAWTRAGGTGVKWLNGVNDAGSWHGASIGPDDAASIAAKLARRVASGDAAARGRA